MQQQAQGQGADVDELGYVRLVSGRLCRRPDLDRRDLEQAAFLAFIRCVPRYNLGAGASLRTFTRHRVIGEMMSEVRRTLRRGQVEVAAEEADSGQSREPAQDSAFAIAEANRILSECMSSVSKQDREILRLRYCEDATYAEIAERMKMSIPAIWQRHSKALAVIREKLNEAGITALSEILG